MRTTFKQRVAELSGRPDRIFKAYLAEDYDGIGQYVMLSLTRSGVTNALKGRIASGDFGGGRTFPEGTPVVVIAYRGQLEVFLGNIPNSCGLDTFGGRTVNPGWGTSSSGYDWYLDPSVNPGLSGFIQVLDGYGVYTPEIGGVTSPGDLVLVIPDFPLTSPIFEATAVISGEDTTTKNSHQSLPSFYIGAWSGTALIPALYRGPEVTLKSNGFLSLTGRGGNDPGDVTFVNMTNSDDWGTLWNLHFQIEGGRVRASLWRQGETEPADWMVQGGNTGSTLSLSTFYYFNPDIGNATHVHSICPV